MKSIIVIGRALLPQGTMTAETAENAEKKHYLCDLCALCGECRLRFHTFMCGRSQQSPPISIGGDGVGRELLEMRAYVFASRGHEPGLQTIIDGFGDRLHGPVPGLERRDNLLLALPPVLEAGAHQSRRIVDARTVRRKEPARVELEHALEGREVLRQVAAPARLDHH